MVALRRYPVCVDGARAWASLLFLFLLGVFVVCRVLCFSPFAPVAFEGAVPSSPVLRFWGLPRCRPGRRRGRPVWSVSFVFRFGSRRVFGGFRAVVCFCSSRREVARLLWRFRAARRWWRSSAAPPRSVVGASFVPVFGLRWLASFPCGVVVSGVSSAARFSVPAGRVRRPCAVRCFPWSSVPLSVLCSLGC